MTLLAMTGIGVVRIVLTYPFFFQTVDEPVHIVRGMWWLQGGYASKCSNYGNPPLAQIAAAIPLYSDGLRIEPFSHCSADQGSAVLQSRNLYERNLALARSGILPFFVVASLVVWSWCHRLFGPLPALAAVFLLQGLPPVLAHAGLATTDMALAALLPVALYFFSLWLENPSLMRSALLGVALGFALLAKLSAGLFFLLGAFLNSGVWIADASLAGIWSWSAIRGRFRLLGVASLLAFAVIWAGYRFSCSAPLTKASDRPHRIGRLLGVEHLPPRLRESFFRIVEMPIPAGGFFASIRTVQTLNADGWPSYFMGEFRRTGWWYFFPGLIALKSPLSFLILLLVGCGYLFLGKTDMPRWKRFAPLLGAGAILLVSLSSRLNYGLRHVLPVYPLFAIVAGFALTTLVSASHWRIGSRLLALGLTTWFVLVSVKAHPNYLTYFNELSGPKPEEITVDSDLGWGQDVKRLLAKIREMRITQLWYRCLGCSKFGDARLALVPEFPREMRELQAYEPVSGWVAVDEWALKVEGEKQRREGESRRAFDWLEGHQFLRIGKSVRLYYVPPSGARVVGEEVLAPGVHRTASHAGL